MITEQQVNEFEQKAKDDALKAFNDMLATFKSQSEHIRDLNDKLFRQRALMNEWAREAGYDIDWNNFTASL
jgi:hypothetical protein